jgi:hypothetical protein
VLGFVGGSVDASPLGPLGAGEKRAHDSNRVITKDLGNCVHVLPTEKR